MLFGYDVLGYFLKSGENEKWHLIKQTLTL